jgi:hypothetical protein
MIGIPGTAYLFGECPGEVPGTQYLFLPEELKVSGTFFLAIRNLQQGSPVAFRSSRGGAGCLRIEIAARRLP